MNIYANLGRKKYDFFYLTINTLQKGEVKLYPLIFEGDGKEVHPFSSYLRDTFMGFSLADKSYNTVKNFHINYVVMFLNFIFNDSKTPINDISELTIEMVQEFIDKYCQGYISMNSTGKKPNKKTANAVNTAITHFVYWLCWKKDKKTKRKIYKMKYISTNDFETSFINKKSYSGKSKQVQVLNRLVTADASQNKNKRKKAMEAGKYTIEKLIDISLMNDPMLTFGIVLGAYAGLRQGYITQLHDGRMASFQKGTIFNMSLDFNYESLLRDDGKITSHIKRKCDVPIYPGCAEVIYTYYKVHMDLLRHKGLYPNKYGAIFIDERGKAMNTKTYMRRFKELSKILESVITKEANMGISKAIVEERMLSEALLTPHSLRHYFKRLIEEIEKNHAAIAYYLAHGALESQLDYTPPTALTESIRECQAEALSIKNIIKN